MAYMADVYVLKPHRGRGLGVALVREMIEGAGAPAGALDPPHRRRRGRV